MAPKTYVEMMIIKELSKLENLKFLGEISGYDLYYFLTHSFKRKLFGLETCICPHYLVLNFIK
jgi:hypothetical protein